MAIEQKDDRIIGAQERIARAKQFKQEQEAMRSGTRFKDPDQAVAVVFVFCLACVLSFFWTIGPLVNGTIDMSVGSKFMDQLLFGPGFPAMMNDPDIDRLIAVLVRGFTLFLAMGIPPLLSKILMAMIGREHVGPYVLFWGVNVLLAIIYYFTADIVAEGIQAVMGMI